MVDNVWNGLHILDLRATSRRLHFCDQGAPMRHDTLLAGGRKPLPGPRPCLDTSTLPAATLVRPQLGWNNRNRVDIML